MIPGKLYNIDNNGKVFNVYPQSLKNFAIMLFNSKMEYTKNIQNAMFIKKDIVDDIDYGYFFLHENRIIYIYDEIEKQTLNFVQID